MNTILITGTGAVKNGWLPVLKGLERVFPSAVPHSDPNLVFATVVHKLRWLDSQLDSGKHNTTRLARLQNAFDRTVSEYQKIKKAIIEELDKAHAYGVICPRDELKLLDYLYLSTETRIITTNWDSTTRDFAGNRFETLFLHGCTSKTLFLPSETIEERYRKRANLEAPLDMAAALAMKWLQDYGDRLVIYGLSLSPLDVELGLVIADGFHGTSHPKSAVIVDPDYEVVKQRLRFFVPHVEPECYRPADLSRLMHE